MPRDEAAIIVRCKLDLQLLRRGTCALRVLAANRSQLGARSAVGFTSLPHAIAVEIEGVFEID